MVGQCLAYPTRIPFLGHQIRPHIINPISVNISRSIHSPLNHLTTIDNKVQNVINANVDIKFSAHHVFLE